MNNPKQPLRGQELGVQIGCLGSGCLAKLGRGGLPQLGHGGKDTRSRLLSACSLPSLCLGCSQGLQPSRTKELNPLGLQVRPESLPVNAECDGIHTMKGWRGRCQPFASPGRLPPALPKIHFDQVYFKWKPEEQDNSVQWKMPVFFHLPSARTEMPCSHSRMTTPSSSGKQFPKRYSSKHLPPVVGHCSSHLAGNIPSTSCRFI